MSPAQILLWRNIRMRIEDAYLMLHQTLQPKTGNAKKSAYYREAITLICSVIEAMIFSFIIEKTADENPIIVSKKQYSKRQDIPVTVTRGVALYLCEITFEVTRLRDSTCSFKNMCDFCKNKGYLTPQECRRLQYVRDLRNRIHIQGLTEVDRGYTIRQWHAVTGVLRMLFSK